MLSCESSVATRPRQHAGVRVLLLAAFAMLAGCGQKGPLYLPGAPPAAETTPVDAPAPAPATPATAASAPIRP